MIELKLVRGHQLVSVKDNVGRKVSDEYLQKAWEPFIP